MGGNWMLGVGKVKSFVYLQQSQFVHLASQWHPPAGSRSQQKTQQRTNPTNGNPNPKERPKMRPKLGPFLSAS